LGLIKELTEGFLQCSLGVLVMCSVARALLIENTHRMKLIEQTLRIEGHDGRFVQCYKGVNATKQVSRFFRDSVVGDSPTEASSMNIQAIDRRSNIPLKWRLAKDSPYQKIVEIYFHQPLPPGGEFDIEWSSLWLGTFTRREDYAFYPINYYKRGVEKLIARLMLNKVPSYVELIRVDRNKVFLESSQPEIKKDKECCVVECTIENPRHIYLLQYGRQDL